MECDFGTICRTVEPRRDSQEYGEIQVHAFRRSDSLRRMAQYLLLVKGFGMRASRQMNPSILPWLLRSALIWLVVTSGKADWVRKRR